MREKGLERLSTLPQSKNHQHYIVMHYLIRDLKFAIDKYAKGDLVDIGCGNKPYEFLYKKNTKSNIGCDIVQSSENKVDVICEATNLDLQNNSVDTVFSTQVIEHVGNPQKMVQESFRVLRDDGYAIFSMPFCWELHEEPYDFFRYSKYGVKELFTKAGFEIIEIKANGGKWATIFQMNINMLYTVFGKKGVLRKGLKFLFLNMKLTSIFNRLAIWIDNKHYDDVLTLNYVVVAKKKS